MKILLIEDDREAASYLIQALDEAATSPTTPPTARPATPWPRAWTTTC